MSPGPVGPPRRGSPSSLITSSRSLLHFRRAREGARRGYRGKWSPPRLRVGTDPRGGLETSSICLPWHGRQPAPGAQRPEPCPRTPIAGHGRPRDCARLAKVPSRTPRRERSAWSPRPRSGAFRSKPARRALLLITGVPQAQPSWSPSKTRAPSSVSRRSHCRSCGSPRMWWMH